VTLERPASDSEQRAEGLQAERCAYAGQAKVAHLLADLAVA
jgi:hypothetical protein